MKLVHFGVQAGRLWGLALRGLGLAQFGDLTADLLQGKQLFIHFLAFFDSIPLLIAGDQFPGIGNGIFAFALLKGVVHDAHASFGIVVFDN